MPAGPLIVLFLIYIEIRIKIANDIANPMKSPKYQVNAMLIAMEIRSMVIILV
jgi:hypothetical protein